MKSVAEYFEPGWEERQKVFAIRLRANTGACISIVVEAKRHQTRANYISDTHYA